jgi:pilus assembly protein Flp/PilA
VSSLIRQGLIRLGAQFLRDDNGATAIEYAIIAGTLSIAIATVVTSLGSTLNTTFTSVQTAFK